MRMGTAGKKSRRRRGKSSSSTPTTAPKSIPKYSSAGLVVGHVSSNMVESIFSPMIVNTADVMLEQYAGDLLDYQDLVREIKENNQQEVQVDATGNVEDLFPPHPTRPLFASQASIDDFVLTLTEISKHFDSSRGGTNGWKIHANAAKFERQLDEKYGIFRPLITNHPQIEQFVKTLQRKYAMGQFSPFRQGEAPIGATTSIILLFMMQRNGVRWEVLVLMFLFLLVGLQPWALVAIAAVVHHQFQKRKHTTVGTMKSVIEPLEPYYKHDEKDKDASATKDDNRVEYLSKPVGTQLKDGDELNGKDYDTIILGSGPATLYTAALLSRAGRKVLVLSSKQDASGCLTLLEDSTSKQLQNIPFDVDSSNVSRLNKMQSLLAPALVTTTDLQGGIRFAEIGTVTDGYTFEILSIPGMGTGSGREGEPFVLRAAGGISSLMEDTASYLGDGWPGMNGEIGNSMCGTYLAVCAAINESASDFYMSKVLPENLNSLRSSSTYQDMSLRYASNMLDRYFSLNAHIRSLMAGLGCKGESIKPSKTSIAAHVTNICAALSGEGMHYPVGGPRALCHALATVVEQSGGRIVTGVNVKELLFAPPKEGDKDDASKKKKTSDESAKDEENEEDAPRCIGVKLANGGNVTLDASCLEDESSGVNPAILSMEGFIQTFIRWLPESIRTRYKVPRGLPALTESRPVFKVLVGLKGGAEELSLTGADFYRLPQASVARDEMDPDTGTVKLGVIGGPDDDEEADQESSDAKRRDKTAKPQVEDADEATTTTDVPTLKKKKARKVKFDTGKSWIHISFPSAKDPSFASCHKKDVTTCVVTVEADDDFVTFFDTKPKLYVNKSSIDSGALTRLMERVKNDLVENFPQLEGNIAHVEVRGPYYRGLSHNPERYAAKGIRADTPYPGLYMGGSDLTVGETFAGSIVGGWLVANAVQGYSMVDHLYLNKNISSDLERFLNVPPLLEEEDLAVPHTRPEPALPETPTKAESGNQQEPQETA